MPYLYATFGIIGSKQSVLVYFSEIEVEIEISHRTILTNKHFDKYDCMIIYMYME